MHVESNNDLQNLENSTNVRTREGSIMNPHMLLKDYIRVWLETFKQNSIKSASYDRLLTSLAALDGFDIARMAIEDITFFDIQRYINELVDRGYALTTIKKQTRIVTAPLKQAAAMRVLPADPCCGIIFPSQQRFWRPIQVKGTTFVDVLVSPLDGVFTRVFTIFALLIMKGV